jgi:hypothetical protein
MKKPVARTKVRSAKSAGARTARRAASPATRANGTALTAPMKGTERRQVGHVTLDVARTGDARVKRMIYPAGFHWSKDMKAAVGTDFCMHAHVGFLAQGEIHIEFSDGCIVEFKAPQIVSIAPGHDGWVVGTEPVVMIEFDFERDTVQRLGMPDEHRH